MFWYYNKSQTKVTLFEIKLGYNQLCAMFYSKI